MTRQKDYEDEAHDLVQQLPNEEMHQITKLDLEDS